MPLAFHKYHGCANDFVLLDLVAEPAWSEVDLAAASPFLCDRRRGIGADQVLVLEQGDSADSVAMRIFNADGSAAGMCGNGLRCGFPTGTPRRVGALMANGWPMSRGGAKRTSAKSRG
jgi:diaminopimelate epimerase